MIKANQPGSKPLEVPKIEPNPAVVPLPMKKPVRQPKKPVPVYVPIREPEKVIMAAPNTGGFVFYSTFMSKWVYGKFCGKQKGEV